jgi:hypothetical protein
VALAGAQIPWAPGEADRVKSGVLLHEGNLKLPMRVFQLKDQVVA